MDGLQTAFSMCEGHARWGCRLVLLRRAVWCLAAMCACTVVVRGMNEGRGSSTIQQAPSPNAAGRFHAANPKSCPFPSPHPAGVRPACLQPPPHTHAHTLQPLPTTTHPGPGSPVPRLPPTPGRLDGAHRVRPALVRAVAVPGAARPPHHGLHGGGRPAEAVAPRRTRRERGGSSSSKGGLG